MIFTKYSWVQDRILEIYPEEPKGNNAFDYALEMYLRGLPGLDIAIDGWVLQQIIDESPEELHTIGICRDLTSCRHLPVECRFSLEAFGIRYWVRAGEDSATWSALSDTKKWNSVYMHATEGHQKNWEWELPIEGFDCINPNGLTIKN